MRTTLAGITDAASAQAALPKLREATTQIDKVDGVVGQLSAEQRKLLAGIVNPMIPTLNQLRCSLDRTGLQRQIPCTLGNNREFDEKWPDSMNVGHGLCRHFKTLGDQFPSRLIREFLRASREAAGSDFRRTGN
jgi:hypothetical protein